MPASPSLGQIEASRRNGACSKGPVSEAGKARSALNGVRHGLSGRTFFLLADEDPAEFEHHEAMWLAAWAPRDLHEQEAAGAAVRALWRQERADRLEAQVLTELFAADAIADQAEREAAKSRAFKQLATLLRYQGRVEREHREALRTLESLRQRRSVGAPALLPREPEPRASMAPAAAAVATELLELRPAPAAVALQGEPERPLNRHQRCALEAMSRRAAA